MGCKAPPQGEGEKGKHRAGHHRPRIIGGVKVWDDIELIEPDGRKLARACGSHRIWDTRLNIREKIFVVFLKKKTTRKFRAPDCPIVPSLCTNVVWVRDDAESTIPSVTRDERRNLDSKWTPAMQYCESMQEGWCV